MFNKLTIKTKIISLVVISLSVLAIILTIFSVNKAKSGLIKQNYAMLTAARDSKSNQISNFFKERAADISVLSSSYNIISLSKALNDTYETLDIDTNKKFPTQLIDIQNINAKYENYLKKYLQEYSYYDIFLINPNTAQVIYSVAKESDYGQSLKHSQLKNSGLADVFNKTLENRETTYVDMQPYAPSDGKPAMFLGTPVFDGENIISVLVFQISHKAINKIMQFRKGYGDSQEDYLVGSDLLMRSDSYLNPQSLSLVSSFANNSKINTFATQNALEGKTNTEVIKDYNNNPVLSAYSSIDISDDIKWAILSEINEKEVLKTPNAIRNLIISIAIGLLVLVIVGTVIIINNVIVKRLNNFQDGLIGFFDYINRKANDVKQLESDSFDEIGLMSKVVNENILKAKKGIEEDRAIIDEAISVLGNFEQGDLHQRIKSSVNNPALNELRDVLNKMADNLEKNIANILKTLEEFSKYNYKKRVDASGTKEHLEKLALGVNSLGDSITQMLVQNKKNGLIVDDSSGILLRNVDILNQASNEAAASLEETAAALEEITGNVKSTSLKVSEMSDFAAQVTSSANQGQELANKTTSAMDDINEQVNSINDAITVIDQIAFQTNILSLNAAVEAATAGEAGKGFAVVAQEVRNLASRSAQAAKEIKDLVEHANLKANEGKNIARNMIEGYTSLNTNIDKTTQLISDVSNASKEQEAGIIQINDAINSLDQQTQKNASVATQTQEIATNTAALAKEIVFEVDKKEFDGKDSIDISSHKIKQTNTTSTINNSTQNSNKTNSNKINQKSERKSTFEDTKNDDEWESF